VAKLRSLAVCLLALACFWMLACQTTGTTKTSGDTPSGKQVSAAPQAKTSAAPASSAGKKTTAAKAGKAGKATSVTAAKAKKVPAKAVDQPRNLLKKLLGWKIDTLRGLLYGTLAVIFLVVIGAVAAERAGKHRKPAATAARTFALPNG
jgi:hypothetical protein